jgi:PPOX class probable FMN-dependent enzyme
MIELALEDLDRVYRKPHPLVVAKTMDKLDVHSRHFLRLASFCVISSAGPDGRQDVSPRGGEPGFVHALDDDTLLMPDRNGNNRLDSLRNLLSGSGQIGMMFMICGLNDVLRVNGRASVVEDEALLQRFIEFGKPPRAIVRIAVEEVFLHCPKALMRGGIWDPETWPDRSGLPSASEMFSDQLNLPKPTVSEEQVAANYRTQL